MNYAVTTLFGIPNSAGSMYPDLTVNYDTGFWGLTANAHVGYQYIAGQAATTGGIEQLQNNISYTDWKIGVTKDFGAGLALSASYVATNANPQWWNTYSGTPLGSANSAAGRGGAVVSLTKVF